jgi:hypothetical protein
MDHAIERVLDVGRGRPARSRRGLEINRNGRLWSHGGGDRDVHDRLPIKFVGSAGIRRDIGGSRRHDPPVFEGRGDIGKLVAVGVDGGIVLSTLPRCEYADRLALARP